MKKICSFIITAFAFLASNAFAGDCKKTGSVCVDSTPCKTISGVQVCLSQIGQTCWEYEDTYTCLKPNAVNYCQPFINAQPQCWQTNSQCSQWDSMFGTGCMRYTQTWRCGDPNKPAPQNTIKLDNSYTLVSSSYNDTCTSAPGPNCTLAENRCIQTTPDSPLPPGIAPSQVAPDGCYKRQKIYACNSITPPNFTGCIASKSTCIDTTPSKVINGVTVTIAQAGGCWQYRDDCVSPNSIDYCGPLAINSQCRETSSQCIQNDTTLNTGCMKYKKTYRCNDPNTPTPSNTIRLDNTYTLVSSNYNLAPCQSLDQNPNCSIAESRCVQTTPDSPLPPGIDPSQVAPDGCYKREQYYACLTGATDTSECDGYNSNPNCTLQSSTSQCDGDVVAGKCTLETRTYRCLSKAAGTKQVIDCSGQLFCQDGKCFDTGYEADRDFGLAAAMMEAAREAGTYLDENSFQVFKGVDSRCKVKLFGLANCCKKNAKGGAYNNNAMVNLAIQVGSETLKYGSKYVYDALYSNTTDWMQKGLDAVFGAPSIKDYHPSVSLYGFTVSFGGAPSAGLFTNLTGIPTNFLGEAKLLGSFNTIFGDLNFYFDPTSFAIQVAIMVIQELMSCEQEEQMLAMRRGQNLCVDVGSYCSKKLPGVKIAKTCIERTKSYCCFNSRLARIINEQGRAQIGKGWGSPKSPDCSGFTQSELERIDFSRIDLTEFIDEIMANIKLPDVSSFSYNAQGVVQQKLQNFYERGRQ